MSDIQVGDWWETAKPGVGVVILYLFERDDADYHRHPFLGVIQGENPEQDDRWSLSGMPKRSDERYRLTNLVSRSGDDASLEPGEK